MRTRPQKGRTDQRFDHREGVAGQIRRSLEKVESFFERHCHDCHDDETQKGLNLLAVADMDEHSQVLRWTDIVDRIESGEMPPKKKRPEISKFQN